MALPEFTRKQIEKALTEFCNRRVPIHVRHEVRLKFVFRGFTVTLIEERPRWNDSPGVTETPVAQFRFDPIDRTWGLYWSDQNARWNEYIRVPPTLTFNPLLVEVDCDPTGIFWG